MAPRLTSASTGLSRNNDPSLLILTSLAEGEKHGHALMKDISGFAGVVLGPGTLYGAITRLDERGLISPVPCSGRRQPYAITEEGREALATALRDLRELSRVGEERLAARSAKRSPRSRVAGAAS